MKATIKQIMPAPGWRLLIAYRATPDKTVTEVHPAVGWGIVEYTNDPRDVRILGFPARFQEVQLLVLWHTDISTGAVLDVKSLDDDGTSIKILPPGVVPTEEDALVLLEDLKSADEFAARQEKEVAELMQKGHRILEIVEHANIPFDKVSWMKMLIENKANVKKRKEAEKDKEAVAV